MKCAEQLHAHLELHASKLPNLLIYIAERKHLGRTTSASDDTDVNYYKWRKVPYDSTP